MEINHKRISDKDRVAMFFELLKHNTVNPIVVMEDRLTASRPMMTVWVSSHTLGQAHVLSNAISFTTICLHPQYGEDSEGRVVISIT